MADITIKRNDTHPDLVLTCLDDGGVFNLTGYTCTFTMTLQGAGTPKINKAAMTLFTNGTDGQVTRAWSGTNTNTEGLYDCEIEAVNGADIITFPTAGYFTIKIVADLA